MSKSYNGKRRLSKKKLSKLGFGAGRGYSTRVSAKARTVITKGRAFDWTPTSTIHRASLRAVQCMPEQLWTSMKYAENFTMAQDNVTGLTGSSRIFRLNSLYDPDQSATGHQPRGYDQFQAFYRKYTVYKVKVQIKAIVGTTDSAFVAVACSPANSNYTISNRFTAELQESGNATIMSMPNTRDPSRKNWEQTFMIADIEGCPRSKIYNEDVYSADWINNPAATPVLQLAAGDYEEGAGVGAISRIMISFEYFCCLSHRVELPGS